MTRLVAQWRVSTIWNHTVDEYGVLFRSLFAMDDLDVSGIHGIIISSVVPSLDSTLRQVCERCQRRFHGSLVWRGERAWRAHVTLQSRGILLRA